MKRLALLLVAALFTSLFVAPTPSFADNKKSKTSVAKDDKRNKTENVKCRKSDASARYPNPVVMPKNVLRKLPSTITLETNCGAIVIQTLTREVPITLTALSRLIKSNFYDKSACHRVTTEMYYLVQCGDPTGTGFGVPDFQYQAENLPTSRSFVYSQGLVVMVNTSPGRNGSQFMIFYEDSKLPTGYTVWGKVISGLEILKYIAEGGVKNNEDDGAPIRTLVIEKASSN
jgi:peptidyl-prolyl cis-trans isomerase B (cyclophilin B)